MQPAAIKAFQDKVLSTPEDQLADALEAFTWKADKVRLCCASHAHTSDHLVNPLVFTGRLSSLGAVVQLVRCILRATCAVKIRPSAQRRTRRGNPAFAITQLDCYIESDSKHTRKLQQQAPVQLLRGRLTAFQAQHFCSCILADIALLGCST